MDNRLMEYDAELLIGASDTYTIETGEYLVHTTLEKGCVIRGIGLDRRVNVFIHESLLPQVKDYFSETDGVVEPKYAKFGKNYVLLFRGLKAKLVIDIQKLEAGAEESESFFIFTKFSSIRHTYSVVLYDLIRERAQARPDFKESHSLAGSKRQLEDFPHPKYSLHLPHKSKYSLIFTSVELRQPGATCRLLDGKFRVKQLDLHLLQVATAEGQVCIASESVEELRRFEEVFRAKAKIALRLRCLLSLWEFDRITVAEHSDEFLLRLHRVDHISSSFFRENPLNNTFPRKDYCVKSILNPDAPARLTQPAEALHSTPPVAVAAKQKLLTTVDSQATKGDKLKSRKPLQASRYGFSLAASPFNYEEEIKHLQPHAQSASKTEQFCARRVLL